MANENGMSDVSILNSIKKQLNISESFDAFDSDIILLINSAFSTLTQLGVGPKDGFSITDDSSVWGDFIDDQRLNLAMQEVYLRVRIAFDPPAGSVLGSMENMIKELDWRLTVAREEVDSIGT